MAIWVYSPAMKTNIQVQLLLARDWYAKPNARFPQLTMLDGLRAQDNQSGWIQHQRDRLLQGQERQRRPARRW